MKEIIISENLQDGFEDAISNLSELVKEQELTPWHSYNVISTDTFENVERYYLNLHGLGVSGGSGEIVNRVIVDLVYRDELLENLQEVKINIL